MNVALPEIDQPVRLRFERPMTDEELMRFCAANEMVRVERDTNGELILMSPSGSGTGRTNSGVTFDSNAGFTLPDGSMRSPDAAWIAWPRWNALSKEEQDGFAPICPEFVIELRSPSDGLAELQAKMRLWVSNGAMVAWLVDPLRKTVEIYRAGREAEVLVGGSAVEGDGVVAGFVLELERVWG